MEKPLPEVCRVLTYSAVDRLLALATEVGGALKIDVLDRFTTGVADVES